MSKVIKEASGEIAPTTGGRYRIKIIDAGAGSSGYYSREVLQRDGPLAFPKGTKLFANHPTASEEWEQPERDVTKIVGKTLEDAVYEDGALFAPVQFASWFTNVIDEFKDVLGVSIYAYAESEFGTVGDYTGELITSFPPAGHPNPNSADIVTMAGRGGAILERITESFKRKESGNTPTSGSPSATPNKERGAIVEKELLEALAKISEKLDATLATKTQEAQAEVDADAIATAKQEAVEHYDAQADLIAKADLLPAQESALKSALKRGEDISDRLEEAKAIAKEAAELGASRGERHVETGRFVGGSKVEESANSDKDYEVKGLFR